MIHIYIISLLASMSVGYMGNSRTEQNWGRNWGRNYGTNHVNNQVSGDEGKIMYGIFLHDIIHSVTSIIYVYIIYIYIFIIYLYFLCSYIFGWIITASLRTHWKSCCFFYKEISPKWTQFNLVNYCTLPRYTFR